MRVFNRPLLMLGIRNPLTTPSLVGAGSLVALSACAVAVIGIAGSFLDGTRASGVVASAIASLLVLAYWGLQAWLIDAGAGMLGVAGRRRAMLVASAPAFPTWIVYSLVGLGQAAAVHFSGSRSALVIALTVVSLAAVFWFLALTVRAVSRVYDVPATTAFGLALLPYAAIAGALVVLGLVAIPFER